MDKAVRIGIDAHAIGSRLGGNETYVAGLLSGLSSLNPPHELVTYFSSETEAAKWRGYTTNAHTKTFSQPSRLPRLLAELPVQAAMDRLDLCHVQFVAPPVYSVPFVPLIADISYEFFPQFFSKWEVRQYKIAIRITARRARRILTTSEHSKKDISRVYGINPDRIDVAYLGVDTKRYSPSLDGERVSSTMSKYLIDTPYILAVGNLQPRKNLLRLIDAFVEMKQNCPEMNHSLVLVGKRDHGHSAIFEHASRYQLDNSIAFTGYVPAEDLPFLYRGASLFAYPSLYEGFGLPVLEAMACGTPVVTSFRSSLPEVTGDAGVLVDPEDTHSLAQRMLEVLTQQQFSNSLSRKCVSRAQSFTWDNTARTFIRACEEAVC